MSNMALHAEGLSKKYHIGAARQRYRTFRDTLRNATTAPFRRMQIVLRGGSARQGEQELWALKDVSFEISQGEVVGVIGRNGAGKSTLLKVLSRITQPTEGYVDIHGRVGSLLEVGTGFHPELTGRENVYLNGAVLGMQRSEIDHEFDAIVEFAEVGAFLETPVKHYSSGMYLRLAFGVAAHLRPEILVVDEVLAVGDASFQKKCLGRIGSIAGSGRTVVFVSHNMAAIVELCERCIWLDNGRVRREGPTREVVSAYLTEGVEGTGSWIRPVAADEADVMLNSVTVLSEFGEPEGTVAYDRPFQIEFAYEIQRPIRGLVVLYSISDEMGHHLWTAWDTDGTSLAGTLRLPGSYVSRCTIPANLLRPGRYYISHGTQIPNVRMIEGFMEAAAFDVSFVGFEMNLKRKGIITPVLQWQVESVSGATEAAIPS